jgi:hypothetical protein
MSNRNPEQQSTTTACRATPEVRVRKPENHCPPPENRANCAANSLMQQVNLGLIGGGTVGSGVFHALRLTATSKGVS